MVSVVGLRNSIKTTCGIDIGIKRSGDTFTFADDINSKVVKNADCFLQTNLLKPKFFESEKHKAYEYIINTNKPFLVSESPSFRKYPEYTRLGWYSYKWTDGVFGNENSSDDRWIQFKKETRITIKDWNSPGDNILIMGQKEGDSSLSKLYENYKSFYDWVSEIITEIRKYSDRKIIIRPHPRNLRHGLSMAKKLEKDNVFVSENVSEVTGIQGGDGLDLDLQSAYCIITYNSLSAVEAVCEGIPTFALDNGSMIWPIAHKDISTIEKLNYNIDIRQWCNDIAYTQWTRTENRKGESWAHLKPLIFGDKK